MEPLNSFGSKDSYILFHDETTDADGSDIELVINDGKVDKIRLWGNSSVEDITYIESPIYLHILNTLRLSSPIPTTSLRGIPSSLRRDNIPYHLADMAEKSSVTGGEFVLNDKAKQLAFKQNGNVVPPISVASGIKSFGVLQRLLQTDSISTFKMLIWDEP